MKVKLEQIVDAMPAMARFAQKELPAKAAYRCAKMLRKLNSEFDAYSDAKNALIKKHGAPVKDEPGKFELNAEQSAIANVQLRALLDEDVELEGCVPVAWADIAHLQLAPAVLTDLEAFIEAPPEDAPKP